MLPPIASVAVHAIRFADPEVVLEQLAYQMDMAERVGFAPSRSDA
jgi:hypothetical protein